MASDFLSNLLLGGLQEGQRKRQVREETDKTILEAKVKSLFPDPLHLLNTLSLIESRKSSEGAREQAEKDRVTALYGQLLTHLDTLKQRGHGLFARAMGQQSTPEEELETATRMLAHLQSRVFPQDAGFPTVTPATPPVAPSPSDLSPQAPQTQPLGKGARHPLVGQVVNGRRITRVELNRKGQPPSTP